MSIPQIFNPLSNVFDLVPNVAGQVGPLAPYFGGSTSEPYVIVGSGQSNMTGSALPSEGDKTIGANIKVWNAIPGSTSGTAWVTPVYSSGTPFGSSVNALIWFANYLRLSGKIPASRPIYIILNAVGGLPIENWTQSIAESPNMWTDLTNQLAASGVDHIDHVMWMQGENNRNTATGGVANSFSTYLTQFNLLYAQYQALSQWQAWTTFSFSEMGTWARNLENDRNDFVRYLSQNSNPLIQAVSSEGCVETALYVQSGAHFSGTSLQLLGYRHFAAHSAMLAALGKGSTYGKNASGIAETGANDLVYAHSGPITPYYEVTAAVILAGGSGGTNGTRTVQGVSGTGQMWQAQVTVAGGAITAILSVTFGGIYSVAPSATDSVTDITYNSASSLTGATMTLTVSGLVYHVAKDDIRAGAVLSVGVACSVYLPVASSLTPISKRIAIQTTIDGVVVVGTNTPGYTASQMISYLQASGTTMTLGPQGIYIFENFNGAWYLTNQNVNNFSLRQGITNTTGFTTAITQQAASGSVQSILNNTMTLPGPAPAGTNGGGLDIIFPSRLGPNTITTGTSNSNLLGRGTNIITGGTGYAVGDTITIAGGTGTPGTLTVATVSGGVITGLTVTTTTGSYSVLPPNPGTQASTSGVGTGATFDMCFSNSIVGPHPKLYQKSYSVPSTGQTVHLVSNGINWSVVSDNLDGKFYLGGSTLSGTTTLSDVQMKLGYTYEVASGAALTLPLATICGFGTTRLVSDQGGTYTLVTQTGDTIYYNGTTYAAGTPVTIINKTVIDVEPIGGKGIWMIK